MQFYDIHTHHHTETSDVTSIRNVRLGHDRFMLNGVWSVGVHPLDANAVSTDALCDAVRTRGVIAVGETGLDRAIDVPFDVQRTVFLRHVEASETALLPLIIHCVRAYDDIIALRRVLQPAMPWIIHGFNKGGDIVERLVRADLYVSFGGALLRRDAPARTAIMQVPMERCMLETDDDAELRIGDVYAAAAELRELTIESLCTIQQANFEAVFRQ